MPDDIVREWLRFADNDLLASEHMLQQHPMLHEIICFHCQQAVEKYLKGYLISKGVAEPPRIHDLERLRGLCARYDGAFNNIVKGCNALTHYATQGRYPNETELDESKTRQAFEFAQCVRDFPPLMALRAK
ncbi:hypothetical protein AGMMS49992_18340 [Clostridia bacterium]|nr:hypothetical protein AGMMS49992_18340 [Clostridia bacterium]